MELFTVLAVCMCIGIASGRSWAEEHLNKYGNSVGLRLHSNAEYLYFESQGDSVTESLLWRRSPPPITLRGRLRGTSFVIEALTQADSGIYTVKTKSKLTINSYSIAVSPIRKTFNLTVGDNLHFALDMNRELFTVTFTNHFMMDVIFNRGIQSESIFNKRLTMYTPNLSVDIMNVQVDDSGVFEIRDRQNNVAMQVHLDVTEPPTSVWKTVGMSSAIVSLVVSCCCCLKRCCCEKSSKRADGDSEQAESPADAQQDVPQPSPPSYFAEPMPLGNPVNAYAYHPAAPASNFEMCHPAPAPAPVTPFLYHSAPSVPSGQAPAAAAEQGPSADNFLSSEKEPCFEMKGMMGPPPLYSECVSADVYTSDKLNFSFL